MKSANRSKDAEHRPEFECAFDPGTGDIDERCVRDYLSSHMPLAV